MNAVSKDVAKTPKQRASLIARIAGRYNVDSDKLLTTLKSTVFKGQKLKDGSIREATNEEMFALLAVADQYRLNPFTREIYAFYDSQRGGIVPIVPIDGWLRIINEHPQLAGMDIQYGGFDVNPKDEAFDGYVEVTIHRKDRTIPIVVREYMRECYRETIPWNSHPRRMLRHKAIIQAGRVAFGFGGIFDPDEGERILDAGAIEGTATPVKTKPATQAPREKPQAALPQLSRNELLAKLTDTLDAEGIPAIAVCEKYQVDAVEVLDDASLASAIEWARSVNSPD